MSGKKQKTSNLSARAMEKIQDEYVNEEEVKETIKGRLRLIKVICWILIVVGAISLLISIISISQILAFIGLSLLFWGVILLYVQPGEYTKKVLLDIITPSSLETLNQIKNELGYRGEVIYLPSKYLKDPKTNKAYLPKQPGEKPPEPNLILKQENQLFLKTPEGILFTPPGAQLTELFEKTLGINFTQVNLQYFKQNLPKLFIEDLEIAENLEIKIKSSKPSKEKSKTDYGIIHVKITNSVFKLMDKENPKLSQIYNTFGSPISNAIACALTKVTGEPLTIEDTQSSENGKTIDITYKIETLEYSEQLETPFTETIGAIVYAPVFPRFVSLALILLGSLTLIWIDQLIWYDMTVWNKDLGFILFTHRTGESIDLGVGMKVIYYFTIGLALLLSGTLTYLKKGKNIIGALLHPANFPRLIALFFTVLGCLTLFWIGDLICYEMIVWHKNLSFILFTYGVTEPVGLGVGMKVIYYLIIGFILFLSGILLLFRERNKLKK